MSKRVILVVVTVFLSSVSFASKDKSQGTLVFPEVTARGKALYDYDQAAWHASDAVQALHPSVSSIGRYIASKSGTGWTVAFGHLNEQRDRFIVGYEAVEGATIEQFSVKAVDPPREDSSFYLSAAKGIDTALADFRGEKRPYNVAVLPADQGRLYVYVLPAQTKDDVYPLGGDARYLISPDGSSILEKRQMHKSIIEIAPSNNGSKPVAGYHTHVLSEEPEDTDVFHVLTRRPLQPEYVGTLKKKLYIINIDGTILQGKL